MQVLGLAFAATRRNQMLSLWSALSLASEKQQPPPAPTPREELKSISDPTAPQQALPTCGEAVGRDRMRDRRAAFVSNRLDGKRRPGDSATAGIPGCAFQAWQGVARPWGALG